MRTLVLISTVFLTALPASAQMIVLGQGLSRACFEAASFGKNVSKTEIDTCSKALSEQTISSEKRLATYVNRGILYMRDGQYDRAIKDYDTAIKMNDTLGSPHLNKGAALIYKEQYDEAMKSLNTAINLNSADLHAAYFNRALIYERKGNLTAAYYDLKKAIELKPDFQPAIDQVDRYIVEKTG